MADQRVAVKFGVVIVVVALVAVAVGAVGLLGMASMQRGSDQMYRGNLVPITYLAQSRAAALSMRADVLNAGISTDTATAEKFAAKVSGWDATFDKAFHAYVEAAPPARDQAIAQVSQGMKEYRQVRDGTMLPAALRRDLDTFVKARDTEGLPAFTKMADGLNGLIKSEIDAAAAENGAAQQTYEGSRLEVVLFLILGLVLAIGIGWAMARMVTRPAGRVVEVLSAIADGDLTRSAEVTSRDELGRMAAALDEATSRLRLAIGAVSANSHTLAGAAEELSATSQQISASAEETSSQATTVSAAAEQVSANIDTVSAASEEMGASIREIASSASEAAGVAQRAVTVAETASRTVSQLGQSSSEVGNVIKMITTIAEQTNLLALNATIEAARAGEAGKGFAVVASEVKDLAQETSKATEDISRRVEAIQNDASAAIEAIAEITSVIGSISGYSTAIAAAVEEQTATTAEIARNVTQAATGSSEIARSITGVADAVQSSTQSVDEARTSVADLARMSTELQQMVSQFRY